MRHLPFLALVAFALLLAPPAPADAQDYPAPEKCPRLVAAPGLPFLHRASLVLAQETGQVDLTFLGHASFLIRSPAGVSIVTDYSDWTVMPATPTIATMNIAHSSHHTMNPDPTIAHLLQGWGDSAGPARYDLTVKDVWVRNVTTNLRGGMEGVARDRNSIFVFEVARLCIAHLGHLHHVLTREHLDALGRIDIVLAPVDGTYTLDQAGMLETVEKIGAPVVIPMHYFGPSTLQRFVQVARERGYEIDLRTSPATTFSFDTLPRTRTVIVLPGN